MVELEGLKYMNIQTINQNDKVIAVIKAEGLLITDTQSALDLIATVRYEIGCDRIALYKGNISEDFFILSTGVAGEILQKFINYKAKLAIIGDFSKYSSKPLHDFIYESNRGGSIFFVGDQEDAVRKLSEAR